MHYVRCWYPEVSNKYIVSTITEPWETSLDEVIKEHHNYPEISIKRKMVMPDVGKGHSRGNGIRNGSSVLLLCV